MLATPVTEERVLEAVRRTAKVAGVVAVWLFGSAARGEAGQDSDIDLLVVLKEVAEPHADRVRVRRAIGDIGCAVDVAVCSVGDFEAERALVGSLAEVAVRTGRLLHGG